MPTLIFIKAVEIPATYTAHTLSLSLQTHVVTESAVPAARSFFDRTVTIVRALIVLTKPRLGFMSVLTAMAAYGAAEPDGGAARGWLAALATVLAAGGALSSNQWWELRTDSLMRRTRRRPIPSGAVSAPVALAWTLALCVAGVGLFAWAFSLLAAALALTTIVLYGLVYTPLKRRTRWATEIGSLSGALPPLLGAAAAGDPWSTPAWILCAILLCWQMPHFFAIGWMHRDDYRAAGFPLLPAVDSDGTRTAKWTLGYSVALVLISLVPCALGAAGWIYGLTAAAAGTGFLACAWRFLRDTAARDGAARRCFLASIIYLPAILVGLLADHLVHG